MPVGKLIGCGRVSLLDVYPALESTPSDSCCDWLPGHLLEVACVGLGSEWVLEFPLSMATRLGATADRVPPAHPARVTRT